VVFDRLAYGKIAEMACNYGIEECLRTAKKQFEKWMDEPETNP